MAKECDSKTCDKSSCEGCASKKNPQSMQAEMNPMSDVKHVIGIVSGKGGVGKSSVTANLAATFAALGFDTAAIDADIYGFSLPRLFGVHTQPTNLNGMLMPVTAWGVKLISIGMFAGADRAILWRGPRLQRSLEQFLSDVWWGEPDVLLLDLAPGTGDFRGPGAAQRRTRGGHHPAALRF